MDVQVHQSRQQQVPRQVDGARGAKALVHLRLGQDGNDPPVADSHRVVIEDHVGGFHGDNPACADDEIYGFTQERSPVFGGWH